MRRRARIALILRILVGLVFAISGLAKIFDIKIFSTILYQYNILPEIIIPYIAWILPIFEYVLGICLIFGILQNWILPILLLMSVAFFLLISFNLLIGNIIECGCFGNLVKTMISWKTLVRDLSLISCLIILYQLQVKKRKIN